MEWIDVKKRLPNQTESIGYVFDGDTIRNDANFFERTGIWKRKKAAGYYETLKNITHWMPYPKPPKNALGRHDFPINAKIVL
jgi:hypothetical protein